MAARALIAIGGSQQSVQLPPAFSGAVIRGSQSNERSNGVVVSQDKAMLVVGSSQQAAAEQRRRLVAACAIIMITFPVRVAYDIMAAYGNLGTVNNSCASCGACQSQRWLVATWLNYTPEFQPIIVALSSPLPLAVSLWLITSAHRRAHNIMAMVRSDV